MRRSVGVLLLLVLLAYPASGHDVEDHPALVIDTDVGLDDVVTLAMALQHARVRIAGIVATEGAAGPKRGVEHLERLLHLFNRREIPLYAPPAVSEEKAPPPFRQTAERLVRRALPDPVPPFHELFSPRAYAKKGTKPVVLVLGPLTNLAAALRREPGIRDGIAEVIVAGSPKPEENWNVRRDPEALREVVASGVPIEFVSPGPAAVKPDAWSEGAMRPGPETSIGETFLRRLFSDPETWQHYVGKLRHFHDELAFVYYTDSAPFAETGDRDVFAPKDREAILRQFRRFVVHGRQGKRRVVLTEAPLPNDMLRDDVRKRREAIIRKNGEEEWFAQILLNELHEHMGAYSVMGVKMGLRAAEILNAPQHSMTVVSRVKARPPVSCLNDGLIVATGSTPGRGLFTHEPGASGPIRATFAYNGRQVTLALKQEYREKVGREIAKLLSVYTLEDEEYWKGVRLLGLDIWENWHRKELFDTEPG